MSTFDEVQKWITLLGAVSAAVTSSLNLWWRFGENTDKIKVNFGSLEPPIDPRYSLHVVSLRDHRMDLKDYGFIDDAGRLLSLPERWIDEPDDDSQVLVRNKSSFEQRGDLFEVSDVLRGNQIGAFAITVGQKHHTLGFRKDVPWFKRFRIKCKIWWKPAYQ